MAGWTTQLCRAALLPALLLMLMASAWAETPANPAGATPFCQTQLAAINPGANLDGNSLGSTTRPEQFQQFAACRPRCARSCNRRFRCRRAANPAACYARRAACVRACGC